MWFKFYSSFKAYGLVNSSLNNFMAFIYKGCHVKSFLGGDCPKTKFGSVTTTRYRCENDRNVQDNVVRNSKKEVFGQSVGVKKL